MWGFGSGGGVGLLAMSCPVYVGSGLGGVLDHRVEGEGLVGCWLAAGWLAGLLADWLADWLIG